MEAVGHYEIKDVIQQLDQLISKKDDPVTLIIDVRKSKATPSYQEVADLGRYLKEIEAKLSGGVYLTSDELRYGLSNVVVAHADVDGKLERVRLTEN